MFKNKRIAELEYENFELKREVERLKNENDRLEREFDAIDETMRSLPDDCKPGEWCRSCQFGKIFVRYGHTLCLCGKGGVCNNFIQKDFKKGNN